MAVIYYGRDGEGMKFSTKLTLSLVLFTVFTLGGWVYVFSKQSEHFFTLLESAHFSALNWFLALLITFLIYIVDASRYWVFSRALNVTLPFGICIQTSFVNFLFAWISPGAVLGAPAASAVISQRKVSVENSLLICLGKSLSGSVVILTATFLLLAIHAPQFQSTWTHMLLKGIAASYAPLLILVLLGLVKPQSTLRFFERKRSQASGVVQKIWYAFFQMTEKMAHLIRNGRRYFFAACFLGLCYMGLLSLLAIICLSEYGAPTTFASRVLSALFAAFNYLMPTPAGAGLAESASLDFFGGVLNSSSIVLAVMTFRIWAFYFQILLGVCYLVFRSLKKTQFRF
jgi:uncharacterized membrane protein YbhN (UPF0104 family)